MSTVQEIRKQEAERRRVRLAELIRLHFDGVQADFVAKTDSNQGEISALLKPDGKSFGSIKARNLEQKARALSGSLDMPPGSPFYAVKPSTDADQIEAKLNEGFEASTYNVTHLPETRIPVGEAPARRVYVVGRANGGLPERIWTDGGYLVGATEEFAIQSTDDPLAFLTPVVGTSMSPVYNPGDYAFVEPSTQVDAGDEVLVRLTTGETMLKLLRSSHNGIQLASYNEPEVFFFKPEDISWMYYVAHPVRRKKIKTRF